MLKYHNISSDQIIINVHANSTWKERRVIWKRVNDCPLNVCFGARLNDVVRLSMRSPTVYRKKPFASSIGHPEVVDSYIQKELQEGRVVGPFRSPPMHDQCVSSFGDASKTTTLVNGALFWISPLLGAILSAMVSQVLCYSR